MTGGTFSRNTVRTTGTLHAQPIYDVFEYRSLPVRLITERHRKEPKGTERNRKEPKGTGMNQKEPKGTGMDL